MSNKMYKIVRSKAMGGVINKKESELTEEEVNDFYVGLKEKFESSPKAAQEKLLKEMTLEEKPEKESRKKKSK